MNLCASSGRVWRYKPQNRCALHLALVGTEIPQVEAVHADAVAQAERFLDWLSLELQWGQTGAEATRERANAMLPEIGARRVNLERAIVDVELSYPL